MSDTKTIFLAWQHARPESGKPATRAWFPIGRLDASPQESFYRFGYTRGAAQAVDFGFAPLASFPELNRNYESGELFPVFRNRVMQTTREDYADYLGRLDLSPGAADPMEILAVSGGTRQTDNLEVFPKIQKRRDGSFTCRFFLHGWRHVTAPAQERLSSLKAGEKLQVALEMNNPATGLAVQLQTAEEYHMIGWTPRYLVGDFLSALSQSYSDLRAEVVRVNPPPAPHNQRVLVQIDGRFPEGFEPMSTEDFQPLSNTLATAAP